MKGRTGPWYSNDYPAIFGTVSITSDLSFKMEGELTIKNVPNVRITGTTAPGGVVENLTLVNCGATILQRDTGNSTVVEEGQITTDRPVSLGKLEVNNHSETTIPTGLVTTDGKVWADGGALSSSGTNFIDSSVTAPTAYRAGEGWAFYTPVYGDPQRRR